MLIIEHSSLYLLLVIGLSMERLVVHRHVFAREIYLPMEGGCQDPGKSSKKNKRCALIFIIMKIVTICHRKKFQEIDK